MQRYSAFAIAKKALNYHADWERAWRSPDPKPHYEVIVVGAGGHGLATAYYLAKNHGIRNVAVLEKGWLGGGNTGRIRRSSARTTCSPPPPQSTSFPGHSTKTSASN